MKLVKQMKPIKQMKLVKQIFASILIFIMAGCAKAPINSDVEGLWHLDRFEILSTGETVECERLYYSITRMVTEVSEKQGSHEYPSYICRTSYSDDGNTLILSDFKERSGTADNGVDAPVEGLLPYGINSQKETKFQIVRCDGRTMILESDYSRLELSKL